MALMDWTSRPTPWAPVEMRDAGDLLSRAYWLWSHDRAIRYRIAAHPLAAVIFRCFSRPFLAALYRRCTPTLRAKLIAELLMVSTLGDCR